MCVRRDLNPTAGLRVWTHISHTGKTPFITRKYKTATSEVTGHGQGTEQGPTAHTHIEEIPPGNKQPPSTTDTRKATSNTQYQHSLWQCINPSLEGPKIPPGIWLGSPQVFPGQTMVSNPCPGELELKQEGSAVLDASGITFGLV